MNTEEKTKRTRSPNFPALTLEKSLSQAKILFDKYDRHPIVGEIAVKALGHTPTSSRGKQAVAALAAYGLIEVEGLGAEKKISVSDLAFKILADKRTPSPEREAAIGEAALKPQFFQKIIEQYPDGLPADEILEWELVSTYKFNKDYVRDVITVLRGTMDFAKVFESGIIGDEKMFPEAHNQELPGDKPMTTIHQSYTKLDTPRSIHSQLSTLKADAPEGEYEISKFFLGKNISVRILASAPISKFTQKTIDKLIKHLELDKEDLPVDDIEKSEDEQN